MSIGLRKLFVCLLLIALPLQVYANGSMQHCVSMQMPTAHPYRASATLDSGGDIAARQDVRALADQAADGAADPCGGTSNGLQTTDSSAGHCAGSAGCGIAAAFVPAPVFRIQLLPRGALSAPPADPSIGFTTGAPERPPRITA